MISLRRATSAVPMRRLHSTGTSGTTSSSEAASMATTALGNASGAYKVCACSTVTMF